jgi:hypothetical protein
MAFEYDRGGRILASLWNVVRGCAESTRFRGRGVAPRSEPLVRARRVVTERGALHVIPSRQARNPRLPTEAHPTKTMKIPRCARDDNSLCRDERDPRFAWDDNSRRRGS